MSEHNQTRTNKVGAIIHMYCGVDDDQDADVTDVLADLMHFCLCTSMDFDALLDSARRSFEAEVKEL